MDSFLAGAHSERTKILWLTKLRWIALCAFAFLGSCGFALQFVDVNHFPIFIAALAVGSLTNIFLQVYYSGLKRLVSPIELCLQMALDLFALSMMLYLTRGVENPFLALFLLHACMGGLLIPGYLSLPFLVLIHGLVVLLQIEFWSSIPGAPNPPATLLGMAVFHVMLFGFWVVSRSLGFYLERQSENQFALRMLSEKQNRLRALGALAAGFSHEFASPLATAKVRLARVIRNSPTEDAEEAAEAIQVCERVLHQMNDSQLDSRSFVSAETDLAELFRDVAHEWRDEKSGASVSLNLDAIHSVGLQHVPAVNFAQVILNLLDNAFEENPMGEIRCALGNDNGKLFMRVEDDGKGFSAAVLQRSGEPFVTTKPEGTGLGLYVSTLFAQSLGGELKLSNSSLGARVEISWPEQTQ